MIYPIRLLISSYFHYEKHIQIPEILFIMNNLFITGYSKFREATMQKESYKSYLIMPESTFNIEGKFKCSQFQVYGTIFHSFLQ